LAGIGLRAPTRKQQDGYTDSLEQCFHKRCIPKFLSHGPNATLALITLNAGF
jgi:hypothetical protein